MFGNKDKSILAFEVQGRLSAYLSDIDNCEMFSADSLTKLTQTFEMTECIHSLLDHIKTSCLTESKELVLSKQLIIDNSLADKLQYTFIWTPFKNTNAISGLAEIRFIIPDLDTLTISNFKTDSIENLSNLLINYTTLSFSKSSDKIEQRLFVVKTKCFEKMTDEFSTLLKAELEGNCKQYQTTPTFLYLKHKDSVGHFHKHYSNYAEN
jgi:hypothetical protein